MKQEFEKQLGFSEKIYFYGVSNVRKTNNQLGRILLGFIIVLIFFMIIIFDLKENSKIDYQYVVICIILFIITILLIIRVIYDVILRFKRDNDEYFITNRRIALYNLKKGFIIRDISSINQIGVVKEKNNQGDLIFHFVSDYLLKQVKNTINFHGVLNPREIIEFISSINKNVQVYDDKPTIMGKKF